MKLILLIIYFAVLIGIGLYCRKHATDVNGFVLGGRSVGPWLTAFAYGTSYFSAVVFVGYAGQFGWRYGIAATWAGIGNAIIGSLLAWVVLGRRTRIMTQHLDSATMPQFFGQRFGSKPLKIGASVIIFIFLIPYTASLYNGLSRLFGMAFNIDYSVCIILMAVLTAVYVIAGGYMATAINDFIQGIIMLVGIIVNNGIVMVEYINQLRKEGVDKREAIVTAGKTRLRPILMTAMTTILAMSTMAFGSDMGSDMSRPMAIVTIGGMIYGTLMTLVVVPCIYDLFYSNKSMVEEEI
jgi:Na+/proline symporter